MDTVSLRYPSQRFHVFLIAHMMSEYFLKSSKILSTQSGSNGSIYWAQHLSDITNPQLLSTQAHLKLVTRLSLAKIKAYCLI